MLERITPVVLTYNEEPNIARTLEALAWAREVVIVDSLSDDATVRIAASFPNVRVVPRRFTRHAEQWNFAVGGTGISTDWILGLDADYVLTPELVREMAGLAPPDGVAAYSCAFDYCIFGHPLRASVYPPTSVLFRRGRAAYEQDGHTQRLRPEGEVRPLVARIRHDDRKGLARWIASQQRYMALEAEKLSTTPRTRLGAADRLRKLIVPAPFAMFAYTYLWKRMFLDGRAGLYYALQRTVAEMILSLNLLHALLTRERS
jgi:glycosyltransferase involved in cell wall biosynthesis